jgi:hypothetical protein
MSSTSIPGTHETMPLCQGNSPLTEISFSEECLLVILFKQIENSGEELFSFFLFEISVTILPGGGL